jgi:flavin-binding protein dodecin
MAPRAGPHIAAARRFRDRPSLCRDHEGVVIMAVARVTEIIAGSKKSFEDAVEQGIARASRTLKNIEGAWVQDQKVVVQKGKIVEYRVAMKVTFILEK